MHRFKFSFARRFVGAALALTALAVQAAYPTRRAARPTLLRASWLRGLAPSWEAP